MEGENLKLSRDATKLQDAYNRGFEQGKFEERERTLEWLKKHNDFNECGVERLGCGLLLTTKDYQALRKEK